MTTKVEQHTGTLIKDLGTTVDRVSIVDQPVNFGSHTTTIKPRSRGERGSGTTITIDLTEYPSLLVAIRNAAKADDREPSKYLRRILIKQLGEEGQNVATVGK
jgi:hypothetical protein